MLNATFVQTEPYLFDSSTIACSERSKNNSLIFLSSKLLTVLSASNIYYGFVRESLIFFNIISKSFKFSELNSDGGKELVSPRRRLKIGYFLIYKRKDTLLGAFSMLALPIFPGRLQPSIVGRSELNFRVRDGNGWTLALISTNYIAAAFAVTTIIFTFPLSVKRKMVTRTGFEPMLKA